MKQYITHIFDKAATWNEYSTEWQQYRDFDEQLRELITYTGDYLYTDNTDNTATRKILRLINNIDRLLFENNSNKALYNIVYGSNTLVSYETLLELKTSFGLGVIRLSKQSALEFSRKIETSRIRNMDGVAATIRNSSRHFTKVFTVENNYMLYVITDEELSLNAYYKLKTIQWTIALQNTDYPLQAVIDLYKGLSANNIETVNIAINKILTDETLLNRKYQILKEVFTSRTEGKIQDLQHDIANRQTKITDYQNSINSLAATIREAQETILFLQQRNDGVDYQQLFKYLAKHPYIKKTTKYNDTAVLFYYEAPMLYYSPTVVKKQMKNYSNNAKYILKAFLTDRYQLYTRCEVIFNTVNFTLEPRSVSNTEIIEHPHISRYHCLGNHQKDISASAESGDYFGAIEQISQAVLNLNFYDSIVIREMLHNLETHMALKTWLDTETNEFISTNVLIKNLKESEANNETAETEEERA